MYIFSGDRILLRENAIDISESESDLRIARENVILDSRDLPANWQKLNHWLDVKKLENCELISLREVWHRFGQENFLRVSGSWQFANWFRTAKYCSHCGGELRASDSDYGRKCESCGKVFYTQISPAIIVAIVRDGKLLLAHNAMFSNHRFSIIAGFVEPGETLEMAVCREIAEEVNLRVKNVKYFGSQSWPFPNSLMLGFTAEWQSGEIRPDGVEIVEADWFDKDAIRKLNIPDEASIARKLIENFIANN